MDIDVGRRLREIRTAHGLSQRQLAARSGVTNGTISMIEQNRTSPSVASLKKVMAGIPMTLSEFFSIEEPTAEKYFFTAEELSELSPGFLGAHGADGDFPKVSLKQVGDASRHALQILYERYPPDSDTGRDMLRHESEEGGVVISGVIELTVGDQIQTLRAGDAYLFDSRIPHRFRNRGDEDCVIVSACTPPSF